MADGEDKHEEEKDLAKDVAHLYSLENVEDVPYHTFSRRRRSEPHPAALAELDEASSGSAQPDAPPQLIDGSVESTATQKQSVASPIAVAAKAELPPQSPRSNLPEAILPAALRQTEPEPSSRKQIASSAIAVYSLAGGVGKTTITANLGRIFCSLGERVLLVDASGSGLLPFYFGASDLRPGLRTFIAPGGSCSPMHVIGAEDITTKWLESDVASAMQVDQRTIFDLGPASMAMLPQVLQMCDIVLVPLLSDLNSFLTVPRVEASIKAMRSRGISVPLPFYVFNKFDANSLMDQEARNLVIRQCGDRLLPISIRRSPDIPAAICDRMTVVDHSSKSEVTHDFMELAMRLRIMAPVREAVTSGGRWSER